MAPAPLLAATPSARQNTPSGASASTQPITTIIAPAVASKNPASWRCGASARRVDASANSVVNRMSGSIASLAAALKTLDGTSDCRKSEMPGTLPVLCGAVLASAAAAPEGTGQISSASGITSAAMAPPATSTTPNRARHRRAMAPADAAATVWTIPVNSSETTSGTMVICKARSHSAPSGVAMASNGAKAALPCSANPSSNPPSSPPRVQPAGTGVVGIAGTCPVI